MASNQQHSLQVIPEITLTSVHVDSDYEAEELEEKINYICNQTAQDFYKLKYQSIHVTDILERNFNKSFINISFDDHEVIEEQIDKLMYQYAKIKKNLRDGREVKFYIEKKEKEKSNEIRYARNLLAYFGIKPIT
jgi:hypothetical protein